MTRRLVEMSLALAGQGQWQQGTEVLERVIPHAHRLTAKEEASLGNIVKRYAAQLKKSEQVAQASRLEAVAAELHK